MGPTAAVSTKALSKTFGDITAVDSLEISIERGIIYSLLGPNGAGKSTTISMLSGLIRPTAGSATVFGHDVSREPIAVKRKIGVVPQDIALYPDLTARENLMFWGRMYGMRNPELGRRADAVLELVELADRAREKIENYSGGMKRRINIAVALLHGPDLVIMDEPTVGIDPQSRRHILDSVKHLCAEGATILYTTHYMEEAAELSHRIGIIDHGKLVADGTHEELVRLVGELDRITLRVEGDREQAVHRWKSLDGVRKVSPIDGGVEILVSDSDRVLAGLVRESVNADCHISSIDIREPNLEAVFLHLTGRALRD